MTSKERMMTAFRHQIPDHVPVCPDISVTVPSKLTGKPFYELFLDLLLIRVFEMPQRVRVRVRF